MTGRKSKGKITGSLLYDGQTATKEFLKNFTAYVEQFDNLLAVLTVREMLLYQAELKCSVNEGCASKMKRVEGLLQDLGLDRCRDVKIGDSLHPGISGGQAKRVNIGIALVTQPQIIFLDEPTSGLDSATSLDVCAILKNLALSGVTIMTTIHSPTSEAFRFFDNLLLLVKGRVLSGLKCAMRSSIRIWTRIVRGAKPVKHLKNQNITRQLVFFLFSLLYMLVLRSEVATKDMKCLNEGTFKLRFVRLQGALGKRRYRGETCVMWNR